MVFVTLGATIRLGAAQNPRRARRRHGAVGERASSNAFGGSPGLG
jgi:hypothetical protein